MEMQTETTHVDNKKPSLFGVFTSPGLQFERLRERPTVWVPLLVLIILWALDGFLRAISYDYEPELIEGVTLEQAKFWGMIGGTGGALIAVPIGSLISAVIVLIIAKIAQKKPTFKQLYSFALYASVVGIVGALLNSILFYILGFSISEKTPELTSLGSLIESEGALQGFLNSIELFTIWSTVIFAIGLEKVVGLSKRSAWIISIAFLLVLIIISVVTASFSTSLGGM
ncbi:Yip1 family protein [Bacillus carboniphilus]|uniref:Yip1 family protein n=1 Tax=Bacillus carboniphilus TaxID=86663 RepID=A0ABY9JUZ5_9BACI|nr:Yip1 family protein [Bacillus carboniphilus]WLR43236.1 Yip1 family protein [Bacillus carboniphilus]